MKSTLLLQLILFFLVTQSGYTQTKYPQDNFISPLDIPIKLSGTFGELRSNHFHSGIDIKTNETTGLNVYAIADGYVSRIKIQPGGYGKAIYITHNNGFVSVYGHLNRFSKKINDYTIENQYRHQSYEVDLYPDPGTFKVAQGEVIAFSGNSGRSGGPHLHFEIRTADQKPVNPLLFGYQVADQSAPVINLLKIYPYGSSAAVNQSKSAVDFFPVAAKQKYFLNLQQNIKASGNIYFGINTYDLFNGGLNKNGVYKIEVLVEGKLFYLHTLETFSFDETRYINSLVDFAELKTKGRSVQKTFVQPNNKLSIYNTVNNSGILTLSPGHTYPVTINVYDAAGNYASLEFKVEGIAAPESHEPENNPLVFGINGNNVFKNNYINLEVPGLALYDSIHFKYKMLPQKAGMLSAVHRVHNNHTPLHSWCNLYIRADSVPEKFRDKVLIAEITDKGITSAGGSWMNGFVKTRIRSFGDFALVIDTIAPVIKPVNIANNKSIKTQKTIQVKITDDLSGIMQYKPTLNGKWILMEYDEKNDLLTYFIDDYLQPGANTFKLEVWDEKNNYSVYQASLNN